MSETIEPPVRQDALPEADLRVIRNAGHYPQIEQLDLERRERRQRPAQTRSEKRAGGEPARIWVRAAAT